MNHARYGTIARVPPLRSQSLPPRAYLGNDVKSSAALPYFQVTVRGICRGIGNRTGNWEHTPTIIFHIEMSAFKNMMSLSLEDGSRPGWSSSRSFEDIYLINSRFISLFHYTFHALKSQDSAVLIESGPLRWNAKPRKWGHRAATS